MRYVGREWQYGYVTVYVSVAIYITNYQDSAAASRNCGSAADGLSACPHTAAALASSNNKEAMLLARTTRSAYRAVEHSNSGEKGSIRFDSIRQSDKFAACTLILE